jgi:hypothetical protein
VANKLENLLLTQGNYPEKAMILELGKVICAGARQGAHFRRNTGLTEDGSSSAQDIKSFRLCRQVPQPLPNVASRWAKSAAGSGRLKR